MPPTEGTIRAARRTRAMNSVSRFQPECPPNTRTPEHWPDVKKADGSEISNMAEC
jgi:hypothetical protein